MRKSFDCEALIMDSDRRELTPEKNPVARTKTIEQTIDQRYIHGLLTKPKAKATRKRQGNRTTDDRISLVRSNSDE